MADISRTNRALLSTFRGWIEQARHNVTQAVNGTFTLLQWNLGERILCGILQRPSAQYGKEILPTVSAKLVPYSNKRPGVDPRTCCQRPATAPVRQEFRN